MPAFGSFIFKPKHGTEIARKIIERFCHEHLGWEHEGFYIYWRNTSHTHIPVPDGYVEFYIETEAGNLEGFSECCYDERELTGEDLTNGLFALLSEDFWYEKDDGSIDYSFYERELGEIVNALADEGTRVCSFGAGRQAWVSFQDSDKSWATVGVDTYDFLMKHPVESYKDKRRQLTLEFA